MQIRVSLSVPSFSIFQHKTENARERANKTNRSSKQEGVRRGKRTNATCFIFLASPTHRTSRLAHCRSVLRDLFPRDRWKDVINLYVSWAFELICFVLVKKQKNKEKNTKQITIYSKPHD